MVLFIYMTVITSNGVGSIIEDCCKQQIEDSKDFVAELVLGVNH
jgi:hypothetical protein